MIAGYPVQASLPNTLTLLPTYQCTAECRDCCFHSSPRIKKRIPQERLLRYVDEAATFPGMALVVISGGEPFLLRHDLVSLVQRISDRGLLSRIVTNGYWAVNEKGAFSALRPLVAAGLREICYSTGDDHAQFVPLERVLTAINASLYFGLNVTLMVEERAGGTINRRMIIENARRYPDMLRAIQDRSLSILESPWMEFGESPGGQAAWSDRRMLNASTLPSRRNCSSVLASIVVTPDEQLGMCCGLPREDIPDLNVGDLQAESMVSLYARHVNDFIKIWLAVEGPERILAWAATKDASITWENKYAHACDACRAVYGDARVMEAIDKHGHEKLDEIMSVFATHALPVTVPAATASLPSSRPDYVPDRPPVETVAFLRRRSDGTLEELTCRTQ